MIAWSHWFGRLASDGSVLREDEPLPAHEPPGVCIGRWRAAWRCTSERCGAPVDELPCRCIEMREVRP